MRKRDFTDYINDILTSLKEVKEFTEGMSLDEFLRDKKTVNAVIRSLEVLGEAAGKIPEDLRIKAPDIPWKRMTGMRNKLIHEYFGVDLGGRRIIKKDELPPLESSLKRLHSEEIK
jgi:uncharacterized protein with HEPN domain